MPPNDNDTALADLRMLCRVLEEEVAGLRESVDQVNINIKSLNATSIAIDAAAIVRRGFFMDIGEAVYKRGLWLMGAVVFAIGSALIYWGKVKLPWGGD